MEVILDTARNFLTNVPDVVHPAVDAVVWAIDLLGSLVIVFAVAIFTYRVLHLVHRVVLNWKTMDRLSEMRYRLVSALILSLEYFIAADLLRMMLGFARNLEQPQPDWNQIELLAALIVLRTILSLSLNYEIGHIRSDSREEEVPRPLMWRPISMEERRSEPPF